MKVLASLSPSAPSSSDDRHWFIVRRWLEFVAEAHANLLRISAIGGFYLIQLAHYYGFSSRSDQELAFHRAATAIAASWIVLALAVHLCLQRRFFPPLLKYAVTVGDLLLLTALAMLGGGALSPLIAIYFLLIVLAGTRLSLSLVAGTTLASMLAYWALVGAIDDSWFDADHAVAPVRQAITLLALLLTGVIAGRVVRQARLAAEHYALRLPRASTSRSAGEKQGKGAGGDDA